MKITLDQVIENSNRRHYIGPDSGKKVLESNLEKMKDWKKSRVENLFDENDSLAKTKENQDDHKIVSSSRKYVRKSFQKIIKEARKKDDKIKAMVGDYRRLTSQLISKENIMGKFENADVELNPKEND